MYVYFLIVQKKKDNHFIENHYPFLCCSKNLSKTSIAFTIWLMQSIISKAISTILLALHNLFFD